jgi:hypothetical protein
MKIRVFILFLYCLVILAGCKKNNDNKKTSFNDLFKNQVWSGMMKYKIDFPEPYWITFSNDNTFVWGEKGGKYPGTYSINESARKITLTLSTGATVTATVQGDTSFVNFEHPPSAQWAMTFGEKNVSGNQALVGTKWKGTGGGVELDFVSSIQVNLKTIPLSYTRDGPYIHMFSGLADLHYVINKDHMKGVFAGAGLPVPQNWDMVKQ